MDNQATIDRLKREIQKYQLLRDRTLDASNRAHYDSEIFQRSLVLEAHEERSKKA